MCYTIEYEWINAVDITHLPAYAKLSHPKQTKSKAPHFAMSFPTWNGKVIDIRQLLEKPSRL
jgi:hypothetical protein